MNTKKMIKEVTVDNEVIMTKNWVDIWKELTNQTNPKTYVYIILEEIECEDFVYEKYTHIKYITMNKDEAYDYFNKCYGQTMSDEKFILRKYENASNNYVLEIEKLKDTSQWDKFNEESIKKSEKEERKERKVEETKLDFNCNF